jgi:hypothetical protein
LKKYSFLIAFLCVSALVAALVFRDTGGPRESDANFTEPEQRIEADSANSEDGLGGSSEGPLLPQLRDGEVAGTPSDPDADDPAEPEIVYDAVLDARLAQEVRDPVWAPQMEAALSGVLQSIGGQFVDYEVECRNTVCRGIATHDSAVELMTVEQRREFFRPMLRNFSAMIRPIMEQQLDRLNMATTTQVGPGVPGVTEWQTIFYVGWEG